MAQETKMMKLGLGTIPCPEPGVYRGVPDADYRAWPLPSYSTLALFRDRDLCQLEIQYAIEHPQEQTDEMSLGLMVEQAVDDPESIGREVRVLPPEIKVRRGAAWQEFQKENPGVEWLPPSEFKKYGERIEIARDIAKSIHAHGIVEEFLESLGGAERQVSFVCDLTFVGQSGEEVTHRVKGRTDYLQAECTPVVVADLKTSRHGDPGKVGVNMYEYAYDVQSALYSDCLSKLLGKKVLFYFFVARTIPPYVVTVYNGHNTTEMAGHYLTYGRSAYQTYLEDLGECRSTGIWKGYFSPDNPDKQVLDVRLPTWAL